MKKNLIYLACAVATLASCAKEKVDQSASLFNAKVITAICEDQTKTTLGTDGAVLWNENDAVSAFAQGNNYISDVTTVSKEGRKAAFTFNTLPAETAVDLIVYPADTKASIADGVVSTSLPTLQKIVPGSFANGANLAISEGADEAYFLNACAFLSIKVNGEGIRSVKVSSQDAAMTGAVALSLSGGNVSVAGVEGKTLNYAQLAGSFESGKTYCVVVLPGTYNGLKLEFTDAMGRRAVFNNPNTITLGRNEHKLIADINIPENKWENVNIENAINMKQSMLYPKWEGQKLGAVSQFTLETLVKFNEFGHDNVQKIYNIMGIEGTFNVRVRRDGNDGSVAGQNIIQVNAANKLTMKSDQLSTGRWYHIAVTFNNGEVDVYYDGELKGHSANIGASSVDLTKNETPQSGNTGCPNLFAYGYAYDFNRWFDGQIAEMRIWSKALSAEEINAPGHFYFVDPSSEGLFSYWTLCTPEGNTVADATGHGNTLYGCGSSSARPAGINWAIDPLTVLSAEASATSFECGATSFTVSVNATKGWSLVSCPEWITPDAVSGAEGQTVVNCSVAANDGAKREGELVFVCGAREVKIAVSQAAYVACPPLTLDASCTTPLDVVIGASDAGSNTYVENVPGATIEWVVSDNGDAWTATCSPACDGFSYNAASHTITLTVPQTATATAVNKWEIVASKVGDAGNAPLVLTAAQQCYTRYTLTAPGASTKFGYIANEITSNDAIGNGTFVIVGFWQTSDGHFFLLNNYRDPAQSLYSSNVKKLKDFLGKATLLQDLSGGVKVNQSSEVTFFDLAAAGDGKYTVRPFGCQNLGLGEDAEGNLVIGPEYKDCEWSFNWGGSSATGRWDITLGDHHLNVDDSCTDVTGGTNQRQIKIKSSKGSHCFRMYKVAM